MTPLHRHMSRTRSIARGLALLALAGCGGRRASAPAPAPQETAERLLPQQETWVLEAGGTPPDDTTLTITAGEFRFIVVRNGPPDLAAFVVLEFPETAFALPRGTPVEMSISVRPGVYGVDWICAERPVGARITFKYARHFEAPVAARRRYGSDTAFERQLVVGRLLDDGNILLLRTRRPHVNDLSAPLEESGSYVVAGPK
jgi:hypothetical protein